MSMSHGCYDRTIKRTVLDSFISELEKLSGRPAGKLTCDAGVVRLRPAEHADVRGLMCGSGDVPSSTQEHLYSREGGDPPLSPQEFCLRESDVGPLYGAQKFSAHAQ